MLNTFQAYAKEIDARDDSREAIVKLSRDITRSSKKVGFLLHRCPLNSNGPDHVKLLQDADKQLTNIHRLIAQIATIIQSQTDYDRYSRAFSPGIQEFIEAEAFLKYIAEGALISKNELDARIQKALDEAQGVHFDFKVSAEDYILGIFRSYVMFSCQLFD
jgi:predicted translin family RNA/ssDNA-binding protein